MDERRKYIRFPVQLTARYAECDQENWKECSVIDISREGMRISIYSRERIEQGALLKIQISLPEEKNNIAAEGTLIWIEELKDDPYFNYLCGVALGNIRPEDKWALLDYAYEGFSKREGR